MNFFSFRPCTREEAIFTTPAGTKAVRLFDHHYRLVQAFSPKDVFGDAVLDPDNNPNFVFVCPIETARECAA
jgi:hypothetical protein